MGKLDNLLTLDLLSVSVFDLYGYSIKIEMDASAKLRNVDNANYSEH